MTTYSLLYNIQLFIKTYTVGRLIVPDDYPVSGLDLLRQPYY